MDSESKKVDETEKGALATSCQTASNFIANFLFVVCIFFVGFFFIPNIFNFLNVLSDKD